jgi:hypothetical protein
MAKAEINYLHPSTCSDQKIFWLNITMHDVLLQIREKDSTFSTKGNGFKRLATYVVMQINEAGNYILEISSCSCFINLSFRLRNVAHTTAFHVFKN